MPANNLGILKFLRYFMINSRKLSNETRSETRFTLQKWYTLLSPIFSTRWLASLSIRQQRFSSRDSRWCRCFNSAIQPYSFIETLLISVGECRKGQDRCIKFGNDRAEKIFLISARRIITKYRYCPLDRQCSGDSFLYGQILIFARRNELQRSMILARKIKKKRRR